MDRLIQGIKAYIISYYKRNNKRPTNTNIAKHFNIPVKEVGKICRELSKQGFLKKKQKKKKPVIEVVKKEEEEIIQPNEALKKLMREDKEKSDVILIIIRIIMVVIGIGAVILSVYYTGIWLEEFLNFWLAYMLSAIMVAFSVIAFESLIILYQNKQRIVMSVFVLLWLVVLVFSMTSTVAGQYNKRIENEVKEVTASVETTHKKLTYEIYENEEQDILKSIERKEEELRPFLNVLKGFENDEEIDENRRKQYLYWDTHNKVKKINESIEQLRKELKEVRLEKKVYLKKEADEVGAVEDTTNRKAPFYEWISGLFGVEANHIQFWLSVFPAVFIDLIAPLAIAISMFLRRKRK